MTQACITIKKMTMAYGDFIIQRDLDFKINQGDIFVIMGGSGCVKKMGSGWKVISNKTGKPWDANYDSEASANAALKAYHAG